MTVSKVYLSLKKLHTKNTQTQKYLKKNQKKDYLFFTNNEDYTKITLKKHKQQKKRSNKKRPIFQNYLKKPTKIKPEKKQQNAKKKKTHIFERKQHPSKKKMKKNTSYTFVEKKQNQK